MIYAAYQGEIPLIVDTVEKVADYLQIKVESVKWKSSPIGRKRAGEKGLIIIKFEEE
jgi:hypothetical protein